MVKKSAHPDIKLFEYLNGAAEAAAAQVIEEHLSQCEDCTSLAALVSKLKKAAASERTLESSSRSSQPASHVSIEHPDISELASFFYASSRRADSSRVAVHVALCSSCTEAVAQYARAEHIASEYEPAKAMPGEVPAKAWEMIRDWEESSFAQLKPASEVLGHQLLDRLSRFLNERGRELESDASGVQKTERIPVLIVSSSGEVRSVEFFEKAVDPTGASVLRHSEGSARFDNKPVHALFDFGDKDPFVVSSLMRRDTVRLEQARPEEKSRRADYIIIED